MAKKLVRILSAVNAANVSKSGTTYTIKDVCGAVDDIVMNSVLYPAEQLAAGAATLESKPAPAGHPKNAAGQAISALNGEAMLTSYIGAVCRNARHEGGRTLVDIVVNEKQAMAHPDGAKLVERLDAAISGTNADPIHVSTGLYFEPISTNGEVGGKKYQRIATNLRYDHLAILLNERGAGTPEDGVGMFLNDAGEEEAIETVCITNAGDTKVDLAKAKKALSDAINLHEKHMNGSEPTTGADGEKSQQKMMRMMKAALAALGNGSKAPMAMNAVTFPEDKRSAGLLAWVKRLIGNGSTELSFDAITSALYAQMPEGAWIRDVFDRYAIWTDREGKLWKQDYAVSSDGSVAFSGQAQEVTREVSYRPITNSNEVDPVKDKILAALNAAGIKTEGLDESALLTAYNSLVAKPHTDALVAANSKIAEFEAAAQAAQNAERDTLAAELAVNSSLTVDDLKALGLPRLKELKAKAAPVVVGNTGTKPASEFGGYSLNAHLDEGAK